MTEGEAKTKFCHRTLASVWDDAGASYTVTHGSRCLASDCMAWRWHPNWGESPENPAACTELPPIEGYCGLAGRP
jgi:hypothetical protein